MHPLNRSLRKTYLHLENIEMLGQPQRWLQIVPRENEEDIYTVWEILKRSWSEYRGLHEQKKAYEKKSKGENI